MKSLLFTWKKSYQAVGHTTSKLFWAVYVGILWLIDLPALGRETMTISTRESVLQKHRYSPNGECKGYPNGLFIFSSPQLVPEHHSNRKGSSSNLHTCLQEKPTNSRNTHFFYPDIYSELCFLFRNGLIHLYMNMLALKSN